MTASDETTPDLARRTALAAGVAGIAAVAAGLASPAVAQTARATAEPLPDSLEPDGAFRGKVVIVTGGTSGFGRAVTEELTKQGAYVAFNGRREALGRQVEAGIRKFGGKVDFTLVNVMDRDGMKRWIDGAADKQGGIDFLHVNAGIAQNHAPLAEVPYAHWDEMWQTNVSGMFTAVKNVVPYMLRRDGGSIVFTGSAFGVHGAPELAVYNANKFAVHGLMRSVALELEPKNMRANAVAPGAVPTTDLGRNNPSLTPAAIAAGNANHGIGAWA